MKIRLDNIGIISDSTIELNGLTVITGHNNSGKTTVGKALYAITSAVEDLQLHALEDKRRFAIFQVRNVLGRLGLEIYGMNPEIIAEKIPSCRKLFLDMNEEVDNPKELYMLIDDFADELSDMTESDWKMLSGEDIEPGVLFEEKKDAAVEDLKRLFEKLQDDPELIEYAAAKINKTLNQEFNEQILPVAMPGSTGQILVTDKYGKPYYHLVIKDNRVLSGERVFFGMAYETVIFLDDVYVLDSLGDMRMGSGGVRRVPVMYRRTMDFRDGILGQEHKEHLLRKLRIRQNNLFEELVYAKEAKDILNKIEAVFPDKITFLDGKCICSDSKLDVRNLATGSKMFAIIKMLLERGQINERTLLILDEPEAHLHPEWQNDFAEVMVLLIKEIHVSILLTTHSPNFLMAIETYAKKYGIWDMTNIYDTERMQESVMVEYKDVKTDIRQVYQKLAAPLFEIQQELQKLEE